MAYSEDFIAETLAILQANDGNVSKTSRESGVGNSTIRKWRDEAPKNHERRDTLAKKCHHKKEHLASAFEAFVEKAVEQASEEEKLKGSSAKDLLTAAGIAVDKAQLLRGEANSITEERGRGVSIFQQFNVKAGESP